MSIKVTPFTDIHWKSKLIVELPVYKKKVLSYNVSIFHSESENSNKFNITPIIHNNEPYQFILDSKKGMYFINVLINQ